MRMSYVAPPAYPSWVKPVLVSIGAMFVATASFLLILIWKSESQAVAQTGMHAAAAPAPGAAAPSAPAAPGTAPAALAPTGPQSPRAAVRTAPTRTHIAKANHAKRHKSHHKLAKAGKSKRHSGGRDPLLDLLR
ncbi:MAG TPA: hypothetical protein VKN99_00175 [Polyangia bacterium]|nr:hypothetical protein [Polyangia bacterium]